MPSFFQVIKRLIQGKPVFDPNDQLDGSRPNPLQQPIQPGQPQQTHGAVPLPTQPAVPSNGIQKGNDRTFPVVIVKRVKSRVNGNNLQVYGWIRNNWHGQIELDKIRLLGGHKELDATLRPGEEKEFQLFSGTRPSKPTYNAEIDYKTEEGKDYFRAVYDVDFSFLPDKTYSVDELKLHLPIRDIYG